MNLNQVWSLFWGIMLICMDVAWILQHSVDMNFELLLISFVQHLITFRLVTIVMFVGRGLLPIK